MNPQDPNQTPQKPQSSPESQQPVATVVPTTTPVAPKTPASGLKTAGGVLSILLGVFTALVGLVGLGRNAIFALLALGLGILWIVLGLRVLKTTPAQAAKSLNLVAVTVIAYVGMLLLFGFFLGSFSMSAAILPLIFAVAIGITSTAYGKSVR